MPCLICNRSRCDHDLAVIMAEFSRAILTVLATQEILARVMEIDGLTVRLRSRSRTPLSEDEKDRMQDLFPVLDFNSDGNDILASVPEDDAVVVFNIMQMVKAVTTGEKYRPVYR